MQFNILTQRSLTQGGDRAEEDTTGQALKSDLFVRHFTKIKNDGHNR